MADEFSVATDFSGLQQQLRKLAVTSPATVIAISKELGEEAVLAGKRGIAPKQTGNLRSTLRVEIEEGVVKFVAGGIEGSPTRQNVSGKLVDYAVYVNNGTSKQPPQFYMERSLSIAFLKKDTIWRQTLASWLKNSYGQQIRP